MENNKNKKSVKFQGDMLNFCDFIQVFVFTRNHHLKANKINRLGRYIASMDNLCVKPLDKPKSKKKKKKKGKERKTGQE